MKNISYIKGDATEPVGSGTKVICHCCNDEGGWGSGFVVALSKKWKEPEMAYRQWNKLGLYAAVSEGEPRFLVDDYGGVGILATTWGSSSLPTMTPFKLGNVIFVQVNEDTWVANIIGQHKTIKTNTMPVRYEALELGLRKVKNFCKVYNASVHMPRMGSGLAGGSWHIVEAVVEETLSFHDIGVTVYNLP